MSRRRTVGLGDARASKSCYDPRRMTPFLLQAGGGADLFSFPLMMMGVFAIIYFIAIRPQQKERKKMDALRSNLKKGDRVMTQGGILAKVQQVRDKEVILDLDGSARMTVLKAAIQTVFPEGGAATATEPKEKEQAAKA
jgi:preprotein translocase subunit YajC